MTEKQPWFEIEPADAVDLRLPSADVYGPLSDTGEECPWPWDPIQLKGAPIGQYHCPYCGSMVMAGMHHIDYRPMYDPDPDLYPNPECPDE